MFNIVNEVHYNVYADLRQIVFGSSEVTIRKTLTREQVRTGLDTIKQNLLGVKQQLAAAHASYRAGTGMGSIHHKLDLDRLYLEDMAREAGLNELIRAVDFKERTSPNWSKTTFSELIKYGSGGGFAYYGDRSEVKDIRKREETSKGTFNKDPLELRNKHA